MVRVFPSFLSLLLSLPSLQNSYFGCKHFPVPLHSLVWQSCHNNATQLHANTHWLLLFSFLLLPACCCSDCCVLHGNSNCLTSKKVQRGTYQYPVSVEPEILPILYSIYARVHRFWETMTVGFDLACQWIPFPDEQNYFTVVLKPTFLYSLSDLKKSIHNFDNVNQSLVVLEVSKTVSYGPCTSWTYGHL